MSLPQIDKKYLEDFLVILLNSPSPTGFTDQAVAVISEQMKEFPELKVSKTKKGGLVAFWQGENNSEPRALTAHVDTLGAMVKEIKPSGRLKMTKLGGYAWNTVEGEGVNVYTNSGEIVRGSILLEKSSSHVHGAAVNKDLRDDKAMEVRLDARTKSDKDTRKLGIEVGDFIVFDPRVEVTNGFVRSRHLDDKACVATILAAVKAISKAGLKPKQDLTLHFSNYEEVGHGGAAGFPDNLAELLAVDMAAIGPGQTSDEFNVSICVKDSSGPYHHGLSQKLRKIADKHEIAYKVDIYPHYGSDGAAFWRAGGDVAVALIGPGVDASHNYERTHMEALEATTQWLVAYMLS